ncbi:MAG: DegV family protein, partial [Oscillospiraceae bacterium]
LLGVRALQMNMDYMAAADIMDDYFARQLTLVGLFNLKYAKKSGRLNATSAIIGDALGIKPVLGIKGFNKVVAKVRGDKNLLPKIAEMYFEMAEDPCGGEYSVAYGDDADTAKKLVSLIKKMGGKSPLLINPIGTCVGINAGPKMVGIAFKAKVNLKV